MRSRSTQPDNRVVKRARTRTKSFPLEDSSLFAYLNTFMTTDDLMQRWRYSRAVGTMVLPNIVPRVEWGPEVLNRPDLCPLVRRMHTGDEFDHPLDVGSLPPKLTQLTFGLQFAGRAPGVSNWLNRGPKTRWSRLVGSTSSATGRSKRRT